VNGFERRSQMKREAILQAARDLFFERGVTDASVSEIARRAGVSQVTIFKYFGSKMALAREALMYFMDRRIADFEDLLARDVPFNEKMRLAVEGKHDALTIMGQPFMNTLAWEDPVLQRLLKELVTIRVAPLWVKLIEMGKREGAIDASIPTDAILTYFFAVLPLLSQPDFWKTSDEFKMGLVKLWLYGFLGR
jgi:AcrR family transcriptional regulator